MKLLFLGRTTWLYRAIEQFVSHGPPFMVGGIVTARAAPEYGHNEKDFENLAGKLGVPFVLTQSLDAPEVDRLLGECDLGLSMNWVSVVEERHIQRIRLGIVNVHAGRLPAYRGNAVPNWAILQGEKQMALTAHLMEGGKLDCGRVVAERLFDLDGCAIAEVYEWLEEQIPGLLLEAGQVLAADPQFTLRYADSESAEAFRCYPRMACDGLIDWSAPVHQAERLIRASGRPFAGAYTYMMTEGRVRKLVIWEAREVAARTVDLASPGQVLVHDKSSGETHVRCGEGILAIRSCRYAHEQEDFRPSSRWKSIRMRLGMAPEDMAWEYLKHTSPDS